MTIVQIDLADRKQVRGFLDLPFRIYRDIPRWVPPLEGDERLRLDPRRYPFYRHSTAAFYLAYRDGSPVGRLAVLDNRLYNEHNHSKTAFFYLFECEPDPETARGLFASACDWARGRGLDRLIGPKGFTALDGLGLLVKLAVVVVVVVVGIHLAVRFGGVSQLKGVDVIGMFLPVEK
jgi:hypothetical protein